MPDHLTPEQRSRAMKRVKLQDGSLEKLVQRELRALGLRFKRHVRALPGRPDIVFPERRLAVFVDGDFWHGWRLPAWEHKLSSFWREKLRANRLRDSRNFRRLRVLGWKVVRIWQHQITIDLAGCIGRIAEGLTSKRSSVKRSH
ncbi:MAG: very short patch repair endonuclease [Planctomycetota bacterium]|nr:very short patch repair endonuclease [Planctomycetota bacterium]